MTSIGDDRFDNSNKSGINEIVGKATEISMTKIHLRFGLIDGFTERPDPATENHRVHAVAAELARSLKSLRDEPCDG